MNIGGGDAPPVNGGEFLLQLLRKPINSHPPTPSPPQSFPDDPAVAEVGPQIPTFAPSHAALPFSGNDFPFRPWNNSSSPPFAPHSYFRQNPNLNPDFSSPPGAFNYASHQLNLQSDRISLGDESRKLGFFRDNSKPNLANQQEQKLIFGSLNGNALRTDVGNFPPEGSAQRSNLGRVVDNLGLGRRSNAPLKNSSEPNGKATGGSIPSRGYEQQRNGNSNNRGKQGQNGNYRAVAPPPGFSCKSQAAGSRDYVSGRKTSDHNADKGKGNIIDLDRKARLSNQFDDPGVPAGSNIRSVSTFDIEESMLELNGEDGGNSQELNCSSASKISDQVGSELDDLEDHLVSSLGLEDESGEKSEKKKHPRDKDYRSDKRGQWIMGQRLRNMKRYMTCRSDIDQLNAPFLAVFESLIPAEEEKVKQKQLLTVLDQLVSKEWPEARLYLYGSCANSFGFSKSDIDVCLAMELGDLDKSEILLKLADMLESGNLQNVQALTRARVPIVKLMDPATGISCDICINNVLAVVNTKLLRDYAQIDIRLRQLAFIVKHWAKSRGVNETYQGTLSSYAYVIMCIHFLQQRRPAILPCLQRMETTYFGTVDHVECAYFDQVEKLRNYGSRNGESIAQLVWGFFHYWAYCHDYASDVISVRMGSTLSKRAKDWTRRVGNDRHLICIEDPFEVSHDLGRVVDKFSIRVLREEFERAANIMQNDPNPCVTLFEPYKPN